MVSFSSEMLKETGLEIGITHRILLIHNAFNRIGTYLALIVLLI